jgi:glycosyltransferase involved in cell wall biosynthesis
VLFDNGGQVTVIAPAGPRPPAELPQRGRRWTPRRPLHVAWVGSVLPHKGALVFEAAVRLLAGAAEGPRFTAYGGGEAQILRRWRHLPGLRVRGYYRAGSLAALLRRDGVDLALLLSVVPETYSLALDECLAAGVAALAFDHGALGERLGSGAGLLLDAQLADDPQGAGVALAATLRDLQAGRLALPAPPPGPPRQPGVTAEAWLHLYRQLAINFPPLDGGTADLEAR